MKRVIMGLVLALALSVPASRTTQAALDPHALALDLTAFPAGAVLLHEHVDATASAVNAEGINGSPDTQGNAYAKLHFVGTLIEKVRLPNFDGVDRFAWLSATLFPSTANAQNAFLADTQFSQCDVSPTLPVAIRYATCGYMNPKAPESGMYVIGAAGRVDFVIIAFVAEASASARDRAIRDASFVAEHEAMHVLHLLALRSPSTQATPSPTSSPAPTATATASASPTKVPAPMSSKTSRQVSVTVAMDSDLWHLTLTRVRILQRVHDSDSSYTAQGKFVVLFLTVQNVGKHPGTLWGDQSFDLIDSEGRTFTPDSDADSTTSNEFNLDDSFTTVQPTFVIHTTITFDVAKDAHGLKLQNTDSNDNTHTLLSLGI